jgi:hypothetical protein
MEGETVALHPAPISMALDYFPHGTYCRRIRANVFRKVSG